MADKKEYSSPYIEIEPGEQDGGGRYRLPYGIAKGLGLDTTGMTPREVWEMLKGRGINPDNAYKELEKKAKTEIKKDEPIQVSPIHNDYLRKSFQVNKVEFIGFSSLPKQLGEKEIIEKIGGVDLTGGSCVSCALVYAGNKAGYDVKDFRGGASMRTIRSLGSIKEIAKLDGVKSDIVEEFDDYVAAKKLLSKMENNKEYYLGIGEHASIVKKQDGKLLYLELQAPKGERGYKPLNNSVLDKRFKCRHSHSFYKQKLKLPSVLIDVESLGKSSDFKNILPFINSKKEIKSEFDVQKNKGENK